MKTKFIKWMALFTVLIYSCSTPEYLPKSDDIDVNQFGSYIEINRKSKVISKGELLAIDSANLIIRTNTKEVKETLVIPISDVDHFSLRYARPVHYGWTIPLSILATFAHGYYLLLTAPINIIVTTSLTVAGEKAFKYSDKNMTYDKLKMFARFPQGIPASIDLARIE